ncbi:HAMP domain-containing sensor histidine kinase [Streptomyces sp. NPDC047315]|uniref:sensor histidine kinase n=1 Tax=Streptomyces sp. NPDC047315 TaxID=3155142 RepID=UPI0033D83340
MRRRLLITYLSLTTMLLLGLGVPLALSLAMNDYHHLANAQVNETGRLANAAARTGDPASDPAWVEQAVAYDRGNDAAVLLVDGRGEVVFTTRPGAGVDRRAWQRTLRRALDGDVNLPLDYPVNTSAEPLFVAAPVLEHGRTVAAVATLSPTASLRSRALGQGALLLGVAALGLFATALVAVPLSRWSLRPVRQLHRAVGAIAQGRYGTRAPVDRGPAEVRELAVAVNAMTDRLVALLEAQRRFVADASHQLRNPLTALRLRIDVLESTVRGDGAGAVAAVVAEADRLGRILDELLVLARAAEPEHGAVPVEVRSVARARAQAWSAQAAADDVAVVVAGEQAVASCQPGVLDQVLDVLLDNALGFSPPGGTVTVRTRADGDRIRVTVRDEGPGMSREDMRRSTDRFWRGEQPAGRTGSGLGLAIARALLEGGGGELRLSAAKPHGLIAEVAVPAGMPYVAPHDSARSDGP